MFILTESLGKLRAGWAAVEGTNMSILPGVIRVETLPEVPENENIQLIQYEEYRR